MNDVLSTTDVPKAKRRLSLMRLAAVVLVGLSLLVGLEGYRRHRRVQWLVSEIEAVGGSVTLPAPLLQQLRIGSWTDFDRHVFLDLRGSDWLYSESSPAQVDATWLRDHDYLTGLQITSIDASGTKLTGTELARLIEYHPIEEFEASDLKQADDAANAFAKCRSIRGVTLEGSDLSDDGFRALPLEQITTLDITDVRLTSIALVELRRCTQLKSLSIDGSHADTAITTLLKSNRPLILLWLEGSDVTDRHLEQLHQLELQWLWLWETSVSEEAVEALREKLPDCLIEVLSQETFE